MNAEQREAVRSNARYLRQVRPIDPDEIHEYVSGQPHPAAVAQVLRESAVDLGLVEREDGTFVPVEEGPVRPDFQGVDALPEEYGRVVEDLLVREYGAGWPEGDTGEDLRERIRAVKAAYLRGDPVEYDHETALAYALYHLPDYYAVGQYVFADLAREGLLDRRLRVLDVGAGVGGPALGLHDLLPADALVDYHAVEPSAAGDVLDALLDETGRNFHTTVHPETAEAFDPDTVLAEAHDGGDESDGTAADEGGSAETPGDHDAGGSGGTPGRGFDLIVFSNVWSELDDPERVVERYADALAPDGTVVGIAPADRNTALGLRDVERAVADDGPFTIYAPTVRLWPNVTPADDCWSFDVEDDIETPPFQQRLDAAAGPEADRGEFVNVDVQYASTVLRLDGRRRYDFTLTEAAAARMADSEDHVTDRVDYYAAKLSHDLSEGDNRLYRVADGSQQVGHFAVLTEETGLNERLRTAAYGDVLSIENALVLWNDDEAAYNLVVDGETIVDPVPR